MKKFFLLDSHSDWIAWPMHTRNIEIYLYKKMEITKRENMENSKLLSNGCSFLLILLKYTSRRRTKCRIGRAISIGNWSEAGKMKFIDKRIQDDQNGKIFACGFCYCHFQWKFSIFSFNRNKSFVFIENIFTSVPIAIGLDSLANGNEQSRIKKNRIFRLRK